MIYTGIGSRGTPEPALRFMSYTAGVLARAGLTLRSGGAPGADAAFEAGVPEGFPKHIYVPWDGFEGRRLVYPIPELAYEIARRRVNAGVQTLGWWAIKARNVMQILGHDVQTPTEFVVCWTEDAKPAGGTGFAIRLAMDHEIPVINICGMTPAVARSGINTQLERIGVNIRL